MHDPYLKSTLCRGILATTGCAMIDYAVSHLTVYLTDVMDAAVHRTAHDVRHWLSMSMRSSMYGIPTSACTY